MGNRIRRWHSSLWTLNTDSEMCNTCLRQRCHRAAHPAPQPSAQSAAAPLQPSAWTRAYPGWANWEFAKQLSCSKKPWGLRYLGRELENVIAHDSTEWDSRTKKVFLVFSIRALKNKHFLQLHSYKQNLTAATSLKWRIRQLGAVF